jgi:superfamily II RNA helicase
MDVQRHFSVDERTCTCQFDLSHCEVVQAWASGCSWNEALEISGAAPGDLTRIIGRVLDGLRQIGSLKYNPLRKNDLDGTSGCVVDPFSRGIHPEIRRLCREAAKDMNRYPVKDPLPFEVSEEEIFDDLEAEEDTESSVAD